jgi:acyl-CoA hydrolase
VSAGRFVSAEEALSAVKPGDNLFIHTAAAAPRVLIEALWAHRQRLSDVIIYQLHTEGDAPYAREEARGIFHIRALFTGANTRGAVQSDQGSYVPVFLSEAGLLFRKGAVKLNVALISVSPPDAHGYCSLGVSVDISKAAAESAQVMIAQVNRHMPRTHGDAMLHVSKIQYLVEGHEPLPEAGLHEPTESEKAIGRYIAGLVNDGDTLQMGIGAIPNAVLECLTGHRDLGIHTEMFSDGIMPLVASGVITNSRKAKHPGCIVSSFAVGSRALYDFMHDNPAVKMLESDYVNNTDIIRKNPGVVAINSAIEIDLTGQVCADSIGSRIFSGVGGQMDFIRGAARSEGGKPIIALTSQTGKGVSKIVPVLKEGAGVVTTRAHVHFVATEYGVVNLFGKSIQERIALLTSIAHPADRERLHFDGMRIHG